MLVLRPKVTLRVPGQARNENTDLESRTPPHKHSLIATDPWVAQGWGPADDALDAAIPHQLPRLRVGNKADLARLFFKDRTLAGSPLGVHY